MLTLLKNIQIKRYCSNRPIRVTTGYLYKLHKKRYPRRNWIPGYFKKSYLNVKRINRWKKYMYLKYVLVDLKFNKILFRLFMRFFKHYTIFYHKYYLYAYLLINNKFINNFLLKIINSHKDYVYYYYCVLLNYNCLKLFKFDKFNLLFINSYVMSFIELTCNNRRFISLNHFFKLLPLKVLTYRNFSINVDFVTNVLFREYIEIFRVRKYNEYLKKHCSLYGLNFKHRVFHRRNPPYKRVFKEFERPSFLYYLIVYRLNLFYKRTNIFYYFYDLSWNFERFDLNLVLKYNHHSLKFYEYFSDFLFYISLANYFFMFFRFYEINLFFIYLYEGYAFSQYFYIRAKKSDFYDIKDFFFNNPSMNYAFTGFISYLRRTITSHVRYLYLNNISRMSFYFTHLLYFIKSDFYMINSSTKVYRFSYILFEILLIDYIKVKFWDYFFIWSLDIWESSSYWWYLYTITNIVEFLEIINVTQYFDMFHVLRFFKDNVTIVLFSMFILDLERGTELLAYSWPHYLKRLDADIFWNMYNNYERSWFTLYIFGEQIKGIIYKCFMFYIILFSYVIKMSLRTVNIEFILNSKTLFYFNLYMTLLLLNKIKYYNWNNFGYYLYKDNRLSIK